MTNLTGAQAKLISQRFTEIGLPKNVSPRILHPFYFHGGILIFKTKPLPQVTCMCKQPDGTYSMITGFPDCMNN